MTRHGPVAAAEFTAPHVDLGATHVRLNHIKDKTSGGRRGNFIFVEFDFVGAGQKSDFTLHCRSDSLFER
jgi:hypothetical protein